ncbi:hypothetical protein GGF32_002978 [Allomyces javanicus]|nr:hypothetical protein GGF32_002978 [Allomyces javanicus]
MAVRDQRKFTDAVFLGVQAGDLKTTADYMSAIKGMLLLRHDVMKQYLAANAMPAPMDNPGLNGVTHAIFVRRAYIEENNVSHQPSIPDEIESILNYRSTLVAHHWSFFAGMYTAATGKTLAKSPSPYVMDLLISCAARAWIEFRTDVLPVVARAPATVRKRPDVPISCIYSRRRCR